MSIRVTTFAVSVACGLGAYITHWVVPVNNLGVSAGLAASAALTLYLAVRRRYCEACGTRGWLVAADDGARIHRRHLHNPSSGYYGALRH